MLSNKIKTKKAFHWVIELAIWFLIFIVLANVILFIKAKHDISYLYITHDFRLAKWLCDRVETIVDGSLNGNVQY